MYGLALCSGIGMLDEGVRAGFQFLGIDYRTVCYVERDAYAASVLVARMEDAALDSAPVWDDLCTFDGSPWRGIVDCVTAGFPCQPHSMAGKRRGTSDERWIWPDIERIIRDVEPPFVFLENVRGLLSSGGFDAVLGSLASMGFDAEWGMLPASAVGAAHRRERVFILANRVRPRRGETKCGFEQHAKRQSVARRGDLADTKSGESGSGDAICGRQPDAGGSSTGGSEAMANGASERCRKAGGDQRKPAARTTRRSPLADSTDIGCERGEGTGRETFAGVEYQCGGMANADGEGFRCIGKRCGSDQALADPKCSGSQGGGFAWAPRRGESGPCHSDRGIFAPGPEHPSWTDTLSASPHLAPAIKPGVRMLVDGVAVVVDTSRPDQLRCAGNGVVPLQAATALVELVRRAGLLSGYAQ